MARRRLRVRDLSRPTPGLFLLIGIVLFVLGLLAGFLLSGRLGALVDVSGVELSPEGPVTVLQFWGVFWSYFRWLLFGALLAMSALGLFLLYPLVFLRGLLLGFSFSALFVEGNRLNVFLHFFLTAAFTCAPLLLVSAAGMVRSVGELRHGLPEDDGLFSNPVFALLILLVGAILIFLCCIAELWLLPGFVSHIQPFTQ